MAAEKFDIHKKTREAKFFHAMTTASPENRSRFNSDWKEWSEEIMQEVSIRCEKGQSFREIYQFVAQKRYDFEKQRKKSTNELAKYTQSDFFGRFRCGQYKKEYEEHWYKKQKKNIQLSSQEVFVFESPNHANAEQQWYLQAPHVYEFLQQQYGFQPLMNQASSEFFGDTIKTIQVIKDTSYQTKINRMERDKSLRAWIIYPSYDNENDEANEAWAYADELFKQAKDVKNPDQFLKCLARIAYIETHLMRTYRGTESDIQLIMGGIAYYKNYILGDFNRLNIGWTIRALLSDDIEKYAEWFAGNVFSSISSVQFILAHDSILNTFRFWSEPIETFQLENTELRVRSEEFEFERKDMKQEDKKIESHNKSDSLKEEYKEFINSLEDVLLLIKDDDKTMYDILTLSTTFGQARERALQYSYSDFKTAQAKAIWETVSKETFLFHSNDYRLELYEECLFFVEDDFKRKH